MKPTNEWSKSKLELNSKNSNSKVMQKILSGFIFFCA